MKYFTLILGLIYSFPIFGGFPQGFVTQTNIFNGEVASNLTEGAPLVVSSTGKVTTGLNYFELSFSSAITTTSTSDVVITGMTETPTSSGVYTVVFSTWLTNTTGNSQATISIYVGGTQVAASIRKGAPFNGAVGSANDGMPLTTNGIVSVNGSQAIAIEWHTASGTLSATNGTFDLVRIQ